MARLRQAFGATGVRVTCGADPLLALRSRRSFKEIGLSLPQQEIRPLAPSFSFRCDSCLKHRGRVTFGSKNALCNIVPSLTALALWCLRKTETRHWVQSHLARRVLFSRGGETFHGTARPLYVLSKTSSLSSTEALLSNGTSAKISFPGVLFLNTDDLGLPKK